MKVEYVCKGCGSDRQFKAGKLPSVRPYKVLSGFLTMRRQQLGITRKETAKLLGLRTDGIHAFEVGKVGVKPKHLPLLAEAYGVPLAELESMAQLDRILAKRGR